MAARVVTRTGKYDHITPVPKVLHWLPVKERIQYKTLLFMYQALKGTAPIYLQDMILIHQNKHSMSLGSPERAQYVSEIYVQYVPDCAMHEDDLLRRQNIRTCSP